MRPCLQVAGNAFMEIVRQPVFMILVTASPAFVAILASVYYFGLDEETKLVKSSALAVMFFSGLLGAVFAASSSVSQEVRSGTALAVLSKPVGRVAFVLGKFAGVSLALTILGGVTLLASLLAGRMGFDASGGPDVPALTLLFASMLAGFGVSGFMNYFAGRPFTGTATLCSVCFQILAFVLINFVGKKWQFQSFGEGIDWRMLPAGLLIILALWILAALALLCSTRLDVVATLSICGAVFLLGLMSDHLIGRAAERGVWWARAAYAVVPNWQLYWVSDALDAGRPVPWVYLARMLDYTGAQLVAWLALAVALFEKRELG